ncbi:MAG: ATP-binding protein, partial [Bacillota bacterium]|nr:ATP-binding protein [Bacillota bacterium]
DGDDFVLAGEASSAVKRVLKKAGFKPDIIRRVSVAMYEGEINMVIHAKGGFADVEITASRIKMVLKDNGPGIADVSLAMKEGWSTASESVRALGFGAGMGLPNMKKYTDEMIIDTEVGKGTTVTMVVNVPPDEGSKDDGENTAFSTT